MLKIDLGPGESVRVGEATVTLEEKSGQRARLAFEADRSVPIRRVQQPSTDLRMAAEYGLSRERQDDSAGSQLLQRP